MPIFLRLRVAFIHIPKTAGTSVMKALECADGTNALFKGHHERREGQIPQHFTFQKIRSIHALSEDFYVFTVVRDPYDRFLSEYAWRKHICKQPVGTIDQFAFDLFNHEIMPHYCDSWEGHDKPQHFFLEGGWTRIECLRFETIGQSFRQKFSIELPKENVTYPKSQYQLTAFARQQVNKYWKEDFEKLGYVMEP